MVVIRIVNLLVQQPVNAAPRRYPVPGRYGFMGRSHRTRPSYVGYLHTFAAGGMVIQARESRRASTLARAEGINMGIVHLYRAVNCKTCGSSIVVEYLGPSVDVRIAGTISTPGQLRCQGCGESHNYSGQDIRFLIKDQAPCRTA